MKLSLERTRRLGTSNKSVGIGKSVHVAKKREFHAVSGALYRQIGGVVIPMKVLIVVNLGSFAASH